MDNQGKLSDAEKQDKLLTVWEIWDKSERKSYYAVPFIPTKTKEVTGLDEKQKSVENWE